jgi:hypothetical protein
MALAMVRRRIAFIVAQLTQDLGDFQNLGKIGQDRSKRKERNFGSSDKLIELPNFVCVTKVCLKGTAA